MLNCTYYRLGNIYPSLQRSITIINSKPIGICTQELQNLIRGSFGRNGFLVALRILHEIETDNRPHQRMHRKGLLALVIRQPTVLYQIVQIFVPKTKPLPYFLKGTLAIHRQHGKTVQHFLVGLRAFLYIEQISQMPFNGCIFIIIIRVYISLKLNKPFLNLPIIGCKVFPFRALGQQFDGKSMIMGQCYDFAHPFRVGFASIIMVEHRYAIVLAQCFQFISGIGAQILLQSRSQQNGRVFPSRQVSQILVA